MTGAPGRPAGACDGCNAPLPHAARFCPACGRPTDPPAAANVAAPDAAGHPSAVGAGRYQIEELIGEGSRKRVYRAHDTLLGRAVAISIIKTQGLDAATRARIHREAQAMARLGAHPHMVVIHDLGEENGQPYIVSELMEGGDLESALKTPHATGARRALPLEQALRIADQLCQALEYAHEHGVVHRDVKPGNVFLTAEGAAKLGDLGLARSAVDAHLSMDGAIVGTAAYMAPEQALGHADLRSDLYALGAVLYEMISGRPPFVGDDPVAVIGQHLQAVPVAPARHNSALPAALDELILRLLAKAPEERPPSAAAVRAALAACARAVAAPAAMPQAAEMLSNTLDTLAGGVFVGRERETENLRAALVDALAGRGRLVTLVGEPGIGKTRMTEELGTYARLRGAEVLVGRCYEGEGAPAYWPWVQLLRSYVQAREPNAWRATMGAGAADIAEMVPELRQRVPDLPATPPLEPEQARFRLFDSLDAFFRSAARERPLVLVLDDLHWADKPSLLLLQFLTRDVASSRLLCIGTYRDVELGRHHPLEETVAELARNPRSERVVLRGLGETDVARFIELTAALSPPDGLVQAIFRETEGNPFFVQEVVRLLHADGRLARAAAIASWSIEIPQSVRSVVGQRLRRLSDACNRLLTVAAAVGREFDGHLIAALVDDAEPPSDRGLEHTFERLDEAVRARILLEVPEVAGRYRFAHALVRETLYDELRTAERVRLHRRIGEALECLHTGSIEGHLPELAHHFGEAAAGGAVPKAVDYAIRAAERASTLLAFEAAAVHYQRAVQLLELTETRDDRRRCEILVALGEVLVSAGDPAEAARTCREALPLARALGDATMLARAALGVSAQMTFLPAEASDRAHLLQEAADRLADSDAVLKVRVLRALSLTRFWLDSDAEVHARQARTFEMARASGDTEAMAQVIGTMQFEAVPRDVSPGSELRTVILETLRAAEAAGKEHAAFRARHALYGVHVIAGEGAEAERELAHLDLVAQKLRDRSIRSMMEAAHCQRALWEGRLADAERHMQTALDLYPSSRVESTFQVYSTQLGAVRRLQGRLAEVEKGVRRGAEVLPWVVGYRVHLTCFLAEMGRAEEARECFTALARGGYAELRRDGNFQMNLALLSDACLRVGDAETAAVLYDLVRPLDGRCLLFAVATTYGAAARHLGNLAAMMGRCDDAARHFEDALIFERRLGARTWLARAQIDYARMLLDRDAPGDLRHAADLLTEALTTSQSLGLAGWVNLALPLKLRAQGVDGGDAQRSIEIVAASVDSRRPDMQAHASATGEVTVMFSDMEGFTTMTERLGDRGAYQVIQAHNTIVREQLRAHGGHELELQGDGFLLAFANALQGVRCAVAIQQAFAAYSAAHPEEPIRVRIGLHTGEAIRDRDKFFGRTVILAARISAQAQGGEVLVSSSLKAMLEPVGSIRFGDSREVTLKGFSGTHALHSVAWA